MGICVLPSGNYRVRLRVKGVFYDKVFEDKKEAELWQSMVKKGKGNFSDSKPIDFNDKKSVYYQISRQIKNRGKEKNTRIAEELEDVDKMSGTAFETYCINLLELSGLLDYATYKKTKISGDYGADIIIDTVYGERIGVQCKRLKSSPVRIEAIQEVVGSEKYYSTDHSMVITNSTFTENATNLALKNGVVLIDRDRLIRLIDIKNEHLNDIEKKEQWNKFKEMFS